MNFFTVAMATTIITLSLSTTLRADQDNTKVEGSLADIKWGEHWAGPDVQVKDLEGKVVLQMLWGQ